MKLVSDQQQSNTDAGHLFRSGSRPFFWLAFGASLLFHLTSYISIEPFSGRAGPKSRKSVVRVRYVPKQAASRPVAPVSSTEQPKHIIETVLEKTEAPEKADFLGAQDHKAKQRTIVKSSVRKRSLDKTANKARSSKARKAPQNVGAQGQGKLAKKSKGQESPNRMGLKFSTPTAATGTLVTVGKPSHYRNNYEQLLGATMPGMAQEIDAGYESFLDEEFRESQAIDLNTTQYKFISYFSKVRKAIELAWVYPAKAARSGIDGKVLVSFTIDQGGKVTQVSVRDSSGHGSLDTAIVNAIRLASPFAPLPASMKKSQLDITGTFSYVLRSY